MTLCISQTLDEVPSGTPGRPVSSAFPDSWKTPGIAYGVYPLVAGLYECGTCGATCKHFARAVAWAIHEGYRHIDTAQHYDNEEQVSRGIQRADLLRDEIFLTTKLTEDSNGRLTTAAALSKSIQRMGGLKPNLVMLHYPKNDIEGAWLDLLDARRAGLCQQVGVSNFEIRHLERVYESSKVWPQVNQIEFHPLIAAVQLPTVQFCLKRGITVEGYSSLAQGGVLTNPTIHTLAQKYGWTPAQLALKWCTTHRVKPIVSSTGVAHLRENIEACFLKGDIEPPDIDTINHLGPLQRVSLKWGWDSSKEP